MDSTIDEILDLVERGVDDVREESTAYFPFDELEAKLTDMQQKLQQTDVSGSLPDVEQIESHIRTHNPYPLGNQNNIDWSNGFERGAAWIIGMLQGNIA